MSRKEVGLVAGLGLKKRDSAELAYQVPKFDSNRPSQDPFVLLNSQGTEGGLIHHLGPSLDKRHSIRIEKSDQRTFSD